MSTNDTRNTELDLVTEGIGILLGWRLRGTYACMSIVRNVYQGTERRFDIRVRTLDGSYRVSDRETGAWESYSAAERVRRFSGSEPAPVTTDCLWFQPEAVRLSFPLTLPVWSQGPDDYRISGARKENDDLTLVLTNVRQPEFHGALTIDVRTRKAMAFTSPGLTFAYEDIRPIPERRDIFQ